MLLNATPHEPTTPGGLPSEDSPLLDLVELKWLLAGQGYKVHLERLQNDVAYARQVVQVARACGHQALQAAAQRASSHLGLDRLDPSPSVVAGLT